MKATRKPYLAIALALGALVILYPLLGRQAREFSYRPPTAGQLQYQAECNALRHDVWNAVQANNAEQAQQKYASYIAVVHWDGFVSQAVARMLWRDGRLTDARAAYHDGLFPPANYVSDFERSSGPWLDYARLCDNLNLPDEARDARSRAADLRSETRKTP